MTKEEFQTKFNELISAETPDALAIENFRKEVLADYDALSTAQTAVTAFTAESDELKKTNKQLQETNMKLIMLHPESIGINKKHDTDSDDDEDDEKELTTDEKDKVLSDVLKEFGHK